MRCLFPRATPAAGGELALVSWRAPAWTLRLGFAGLIEHDSEGETDGVNSGPFPAGEGWMLWRGSYAYAMAFEPEALGRRLCATCAVELALEYRHESEHYTGSNSGDSARDFSDQPYVGDDVILDAALEERLGDLYLVQRAAGMWFLPDRSSYAAGGALDLHARWTGWRAAHPFVSLYGEYRFGDELRGRRFPYAYRLRALAGVALPSALGDVMIFAAGDVGHRYGVQALTEEATLGVGVRLALGRSWSAGR